MHKATNINQQSKLQLVLRRLYNNSMTPLGLYSSSGILSWRRSKVLRSSGLISTLLLVLLTAAILIPLYNNNDITEAATGTAKESSLSFNLTNNTASVDLSVNDADGTFASSSTNVGFNISTTNYTGYTLSISSSDNSQTLVNESNNSYTLSSITSATSYDTFSDDTTAASSYNGKWGYLPSKINSSTNTNYLPAPTTTATTLDTTSSANSSANTYTIGIGARATYSTPAGEYTGTYILTAVANNIAYYIAFNDNTNDSTVANLPTAISSSVSTTSVTLPSTTPTRTGYTFKSWCLGTVSNNGTTCTGTQYNKSSSFGLDQTTTNGTNTAPVNLYAVWTRNNVTYTLNYNANNGTGVPNSQSNTNNTGSYTFTLNTTTIPTRSGYNFLGYATTSSATTPTYTYTAGTGTNGVNGANGAFSPSTITLTQSSMSSTAESTTLYAVWEEVAPGLCTDTATCMQTFTKAMCQTNASSSAVTLTDARDESTYRVRYINGNCWQVQNLHIAGETTLTSELSNVLSDYTLPPSSVSNFGNYVYAGLYCSNVNACWYNYIAATAGTISTRPNSSEAQYDICPAGWRLPTNAEFGTIGSFEGMRTYKSAFSPVTGGRYEDKELSNTSSGRWWSSTASSGDGRYNLLYSGDNTLNSDYTSNRSSGIFIRCILKN